MRRHEQSDEEWATIQPLLPQKSCGVPRVDDRRVVNGILWRFWAGARRGGTWPSATAPHTTLYNRFVRWHAAGVWDRILDAVSEAYDGDIVMIDSCLASGSTSTAPRSKGGAEAGGDGCMGRSRGGLTTKIHALLSMRRAVRSG